MHWLFFAIVLLLATLSACLGEEHLVPKHGTKSKHGLVKRDLSEADVELILKTLMLKLGQIEESELMHKKTSTDKEHYAYGPGMTEKIHTASIEEGKLRLPMERKPMDYDYSVEKTIPLGKAGYEMKEDSRITEKDAMGLIMKLKEISAAEPLDDLYGKKEYLGYPEEKVITEKVHLSKDPVMLGKSGKVYEDIAEDDKFSNKDVTLAGSLYHVKIAGDVETYPSIKLAPLTSMYDEKVKDEKLHFERDHSLDSDEAYLKKVEEIGKSVLKEESYPHLKGDDVEGHLKKTVEEDKNLFYEPIINHPEASFKESTEEKVIEERKATPKEIFAIEEGIFSDEKLKIGGEHHMKDGIAHGIDNEFLKNLKTSLVLDKEFKIDGSHHLDGGVSHEINDELMKKLKETLGLDKELILESTLHAEGDISHEISDELMKKLKESLGFDKELMIEDLHHAKGELDPKMNEELLKKLKITLALDKEFKMDSPHHLESGITHEMEEELMKKIKASLGLDKALKMDDAHYFDEGLFHGMKDEDMKKLKEALGSEVAHDELLHLSKELHKEESKAEGSFAYERAKEQIHKDAHIGLAEEDLKKHLDEGLSYGTKEMVHDTELMSEKGLTAEKAHGIEISIDSAFKDEILKEKETHAIDKSIGLDKEMFGGKVPMESGFDHSIVHDSTYAAEVNKGLKFHEDELLKKEKAYEDELLKKEKAYEADSVFHKGKEVIESTDLHLSKELHKEESKPEGSFAYERAKEQIHKDAHIGLADEDLKKHLDEALSYGAKEMVHGTELMFEKGLTAEKAHGIGISMDSAFKDEMLKEKEIHAIDKSIGLDKEMFGGKVPMESGFEHSIVHDSTYAAEVNKGLKFHEDELLKKEKAYEDELLKKEKAYEADSVFHKDKEIIESTEEHHILKDEDAHILHDSALEKHHIGTGAEKGHKTLHDLKAKFFELLRRVLHMRKCHLVTMRPGELLGIVNCVSKSKDPLLCEKFAVCEKKKPIRVIRASEKCLKEIIPGEMKRCTSYAPLYPSAKIPLKIFQCVAINVRELMPHEEKQMIDFEECVKVIKAERCGRFKWFRGSH